MPVTHEQRADVGLRYLASIKLRIEVRTLAQKKALAETQPDLTQTCAETLDTLKPLAVPILKRMALRVDVEKLTLSSVSEYQTNSVPMFRIGMASGITVQIPAKDVAGLPEMITRRKKQKDLSKELCMEISFLHDFVKPTYIASFAAHACRLWVPANKQDRIPPSLLNSLMEDFITAKRPAVCKVA
jgi:hypothetical protein